MTTTHRPKYTTLAPLLIIGACAAPAITLNVWPRVENMIANGFSSNELGIVLLVTMSALTMTIVPFAMRKADNLGFWFVCLVFGITLGLLNYLMAVGAVGKAHDNVTEITLDKQSRRDHYRSQIQDLSQRRAAVGSFKPTTRDMLDSADRAVNLALEARDQECGKVGDFCRARQAQLAARQQDRAELAASYALTERARILDEGINVLQRSLGDLGYIPATADPQAARISRVLSIFITLGSDSLQTVSNFIIHFLAVMAEAFALIAPRIVITAIMPEERPGAAPAQPPLLLTAEAPPAKKLAEISPPPPPPVRAAKPKQPPIFGPLSKWLTEQTIPSTNRILAWTAYTSYKDWCKTHSLTALEFLKFDAEVKASGIKEVVEAKRSYYLNLAIRKDLKVVA